MSENPKKETFHCNFCEKDFISKKGFEGHQSIHTGNGLFFCLLCNRKYTQSSHLQQHAKIHTGEKNFTCDHCQRSFREKCSLKTHLRIHTGEEPYSCDHCQRTFKQKSQLINHVRIHTGEKPFTCNHCNRTFRRKVTLKIHLLDHTGEKPFSCIYCERSFKEKGNLKSHIRIHTGEKPFTCKPSEFTSEKELARDLYELLNITPEALKRLEAFPTPKRYTAKLMVEVFGREMLATHSLKGAKRADGTSKPSLDRMKVKLIIDHVADKFQIPPNNVRDTIRTKLSNEDKYFKKKLQEMTDRYTLK